MTGKLFRPDCDSSESWNRNSFWLIRAGVNSAPELEFIANSNSGIAIVGIGIELELNLNCHNWN